MGKKLLKTEEVASRLGCSTRTVRELVAKGKLPAVRFTPRGWLRFLDEDVEKLVERSRREVVAA